MKINFEIQNNNKIRINKKRLKINLNRHNKI